MRGIGVRFPPPMSVVCADLESRPPVSDRPAGVLAAAEWRALRAGHETRVDAWIGPHLERASLGHRHPVYDFLFEYYSLRPSHLRRWHPGIDVLLEGAEEFLERPHYTRMPGGVAVAVHTWKPQRLQFVAWLRDLLAVTRDRPAFFGCAGLHEWAMVYRCEEVRHAEWPLRFPADAVARVVESLPVRCSHYDAFRFFTRKARPLNRLQLTRESAPMFEQAGCLHANMDLYKWAGKLLPFAPSRLVADTFELARDIREVDMRASPYDLSALGFEPIPIETVEGRAEYEGHQRAFAARSEPLRSELLALCERLLREAGR